MFSSYMLKVIPHINMYHKPYMKVSNFIGLDTALVWSAASTLHSLVQQPPMVRNWYILLPVVDSKGLFIKWKTLKIWMIIAMVVKLSALYKNFESLPVIASKVTFLLLLKCSLFFSFVVTLICLLEYILKYIK